MRPFGIRIGVFWALFVASVLMFVRNRAAVFFSLFLPLIIMLIFGVLNFEGSTTIQLGLVDEADNAASSRLSERLEAYDYIELSSGSRADRLAALEEGNLDFVLVVPAGFDPQPGQETRLVAYASTADPAQA
ncbi:MAG: ABC transporter permease, partial [Chloroflexota bacterium]|nr:ABC transporter permease [Chloroflexota bacterium]